VKDTEITNDYTLLQQDIPGASITVIYSETVVFDPGKTYTKDTPGCTDDVATLNIIHVEDASNDINYWVHIVAPRTETDVVLTGSFHINISPFEMYVIAPSVYTEYDGNPVVLTTDNIIYRPTDGSAIPATVLDDFTVAFVSPSADYAPLVDGNYRMTEIGHKRTSVSLVLLNPENVTDFAIYNIDGTMGIYSEDTSRSESRGYA